MKKKVLAIMLIAVSIMLISVCEKKKNCKSSGGFVNAILAKIMKSGE